MGPDAPSYRRLRVGLALLAAIVLSALPAVAAAGPWVKKPGEGYVKISGETFQSDKTFDVDGNLVGDMPEYSHWGVRGYFELGIAPRVGVAASAPFVRATNTRTNGDEYHRTGFGDLDARIDTQLIRQPCALAASLKGRIPLYDGMVQKGDEATAAMSRSGDDRYKPLLGDGSYELTPMLAAGCPLPFDGWASLQAGPNVRFMGFGNGVSYGVNAGLHVIPELVAVSARVSGRERFSDDNERPTKRFLNVGGGLLVHLLPNLAAEGSFSYTPSGAFVARGWSASLGVSYAGRIFPNPFL